MVVMSRYDRIRSKYPLVRPGTRAAPIVTVLFYRMLQLVPDVSSPFTCALSRVVGAGIHGTMTCIHALLL
jgi:hypothetical protein